MKGQIPFAAVLLAAFAAGCQNEYYARQLITPDAGGAAIGEMVTGSGDQLVRRGRISYHRRIARAEGVEIDVWGILPKNTPTVPAQKTLVLLHGWGEWKASYLTVAEKLAAKGYNVVLIDLRGHGRSGGKYVTYGVKESRDVLAVMDALAGEHKVSEEIYVFGLTLGAATAIQYAAIDPRVRGVMAIAPYKDAHTICRRAMAFRAPLMSEEEFDKVLSLAGKIGQFEPSDASAVRAARNLKAPILLVHGLLDFAVPLEHSQAIYEAASEPKKLLVVTPGPEQVALAMIWESWLADRLDELATRGVETQPAEKPAP